MDSEVGVKPGNCRDFETKGDSFKDKGVVIFVKCSGEGFFEELRRGLAPWQSDTISINVLREEGNLLPNKQLPEWPM